MDFLARIFFNIGTRFVKSLWNSLPKDIRTSLFLNAFRHALKTDLFTYLLQLVRITCMK